MGCVSSTSRNTVPHTLYEPHAESRTENSSPSNHTQGYETDSEQLTDNLKSTARKVYRESVLWHGTSMQAKIDIRNRGFDISRKTNGATEGSRTAYSAPSDTLVKNAKRYNYLTAYDATARSYARLANCANPALVRTIGVRSNFDIELDPETKDENGEISKFSCRTADPIPSKYIVGSKNSVPGADARIFKEELASAGVKVSTRQAGELLRDAQSDSEDDF